MKCSVSVIIPIYNVENYILMCLQSVANQTLTDGIECILVDDCGTDNSMEIAERFVSEYKGGILFKIQHHNINKGLSAARNTGINIASGEYIFFLDSDDEITSNCIINLWNLAMKYNRPDVVLGSYLGKEKRISLPLYTNNPKIIKQFFLTFDGSIVAAQAKLIRRELFVQNNMYFKEGIIHEDLLWTFFLSKVVNSMAYCKDGFYIYRINPNSITHAISYDKERISFQLILSDICDNIDAFLIGKQKEYILSILCYYVNNQLYENESARILYINKFLKKNNLLERILIRLYFQCPNIKVKNHIFHLIIHLYNL